MTRGWVIGTDRFARAMHTEHKDLASRGPQLASEMQAIREQEWLDLLQEELRRAGRNPADLFAAKKSAPWKLAIANQLKQRTTVTHRWLGLHLHLGARDEVCRLLQAWRHQHPPR